MCKKRKSRKRYRFSLTKTSPHLRELKTPTSRHYFRHSTKRPFSLSQDLFVQIYFFCSPFGRFVPYRRSLQFGYSSPPFSNKRIAHFPFVAFFGRFLPPSGYFPALLGLFSSWWTLVPIREWHLIFVVLRYFTLFTGSRVPRFLTLQAESLLCYQLGGYF